MKREGVDYQSGEIIATWQPKNKVEAYAAEIRAALRLKPAQPLIEVVSELGGKISYQDFDGSDPDGNTIWVHAEGDFDIVLSPYTSPIRDRFTIAHELGHYFLHSRMGEIPIKADRRGSNRVEWEANWFAASFLMPAKEFKRQQKLGRSAASLAAYFGVSEAAASIRLKALGIDE